MKRMVKWIALLAVLVLMTAAVPVSAQPKEEAVTYDLSECGDDVKLVGRTEVTEDGIVPHTTASGIVFYSDCSGSIEMEVYGKDNYFTRQFFIVYVDGEIAGRVELDHIAKNRTVKRTLTMVEDLEPGMHRIEIYRETEEVDAYCEWKSLTLNGELIPAEKAPMLIEFVGDSITTGYGAYPFSEGSDSQTVNRQAGTKSYAFLTAAELGMDIQVCCTSGYGVEVGYNADRVNMQEMYEYTAYHHDNSEDALWSFERPADIVVINMGTNDNGARKQYGVSEDQVLAGIKNMMKIAREKNPDCKVVWCTGMMGTTFKSGTMEIVEELGGAEAGYFFCELPKDTTGGGGHPSEEGHIAAAEVLTAFLEENVLAEDFADTHATAEELEALLSNGALTETDRAIGETEIRALEASGNTYSGTLTATYETFSQKAADQTTLIVAVCIVVGVVLVAAVAVILFAVLYKPKKKEETTPQ